MKSSKHKKSKTDLTQSIYVIAEGVSIGIVIIALALACYIVNISW